MRTTVTPEFERLCDHEFTLAVEEAYEGLGPQIAQIKEHYNTLGSYVNSATGYAVKDAVLARVDQVLAAFDRAYMAKWRDDPIRPLIDEDVTWLGRKADLHFDAMAREAEGRCNTYLGEPRQFFAQFWSEAGIDARQRAMKFRKKIEILKMQKDQPSAKPQTVAGNNPFAIASPDDKKVEILLAELRRCYDAECWNACGILLRIVTERALDGVEAACKKKKGLGNKLNYCSNESQEFGQSVKEALRNLLAGKITGDIVAHDAVIVIDRPDIDLVAPYFRHLINHWCSMNPRPMAESKIT
jgi:hypothetical protein